MPMSDPTAAMLAKIVVSTPKQLWKDRLSALRVELVKNQIQVAINAPRAMLEKPGHRARLVLRVNTVQVKTKMVQLPIQPLVLHAQPVFPRWKEAPSAKRVKQADTAIELVRPIVKYAWRDTIVHRTQHN